jgi:hypothetical protein
MRQGFFRGLTDDWHTQPPLDSFGNRFNSDALLSYSMIGGAGSVLVESQLEDTCSVKSMRFWPTAQSISDLGGHTFLSRNFNERFDEPLVAVSVIRWLKTHD